MVSGFATIHNRRAENHSALQATVKWADGYAALIVRKRWTSARHPVEGPYGAYRDLEERGAWPLLGKPVESLWRWSRRSCRTRGRAAGRVRLPDRIVSPLARGAQADGVRLWTVRRELHDRRIGRRRR